jgi:hypothetical protein
MFIAINDFWLQAAGSDWDNRELGTGKSHTDWLEFDLISQILQMRTGRSMSKSL